MFAIFNEAAEGTTEMGSGNDDKWYDITCTYIWMTKYMFTNSEKADI